MKVSTVLHPENQSYLDQQTGYGASAVANWKVHALELSVGSEVLGELETEKSEMMVSEGAEDRLYEL